MSDPEKTSKRKRKVQPEQAEADGQAVKTAPREAPEDAQAPQPEASRDAAPKVTDAAGQAGIRADQDSEARALFPMQPTSDMRSTYFRESYLFPYNPDPLCSGNNYDVYDEMRKDQQIKSCLDMKKNLVVNSGWEIECEDETAKDELDADLREISDPDTIDNGFEDSLRAIMTAYEYGFSVSEVVAKIEDSRYKPKALLTRAPHTWQFELDDKGRLKQLLQNGAKGKTALNPQHFIHHVYQSDFGNPYGTSDLQAAHTPWKAKKFFMRMFAVYVERFAAPTVVARYKRGTQQDEIDAIQDMARSIQNSTALTLPDEVVIDFIQAARDATDAYVRGIHLWDMMIARALLVPDMMGMSGGKSDGGSFSLGETQFKLFLGTLQKDRKSLERKINLRLIRPIAALNYGDKVEPTFKLMAWSDDNVAKFNEQWLKLIQLKAYVPSPEEIDHFRKSIKYPLSPIEINQAMLEVPDPNDPNAEQGDESNPDAPKPNKKPKAKVDEEGKPKREVKPNPKARGERALSDDEGTKLLTFRDLTGYERKVDFASVKRSLDVSERGLGRSVGEAANKMAQDLLRQIREAKLLARFQPEAINSLQPGYAREMNEALRTELRALWRESTEEARREIIPSGDKKLYTSEDLLPDEFERILEAESFKIVGDYRTDLTKRATNHLMRGIKSGVSESQLITTLKADMRDQTDRWLGTLTRTKTTEIYNAARKSIWDTDETISKIVTAYQFSSVLDERTSDVCRALDGKIFEKGAFVDRATPPLHFNCRSILVPITKFEDYTASKPIKLEKLRDLGGNLIFSDRAVTTAVPPSLDQAPNLIADGREDQYGDHVIIPSPGAGRCIRLLSIKACNVDLQRPVQAAFVLLGTSRQSLAQEMLRREGGLTEKDYRSAPLIAPENSELVLQLSGNVPVTFTVEYTIHNLRGRRVK